MKTFFAIIITALVSSCTPIYLPNSRNVPMLSKAGEVQAELNFLTGYNVQAAVGVTNHIALMGNGMYSDSKGGSYSRINRYSFGEFGVGYYSNNEKYYFDVFGGYGTGKSSSSDSSFAIHPVLPAGYDIHLTSANYNRYFIQPSFGLKRKHFHGAIAYRISIMDFKTGIQNGKEISLNRNPVVFFEPAFVAKFPFEKFFISAQVGLSTPMNKADLYFDYIPMVISTGLGFRLGYTPNK